MAKEYYWAVQLFDKIVDSLPRPTSEEERERLFDRGKDYILDRRFNDKYFSCQECGKLFPDEDIVVVFKGNLDEKLFVVHKESVLHEHRHVRELYKKRGINLP